MTNPSAALQLPVRSRRYLVLLLLPVLLGIVSIKPARAQATADTSKAGDHWGPHGHMLGRGPMAGPPAPAFMRDSIQVSGKELQQYTQRYNSHMAATKPLRDSVRTSMEAVRAAFEKGDRSDIRSQRDAGRAQWKRLADQDKKFDQDLKNVLSKDQQTRYQQWKDNRKQEARQQWRGHRADRHGGRWGAGQDSTGASEGRSDSAQSQTR
jgi:hypothetical protein